MIGEKAYQNAMKRRAELRQELDEIESFLRLCERFAESPRSDVYEAVARGHGGASGPDLFVKDVATGLAVEFKTVSGTDLLPHIRRIALERGRPVSRGDVKKALPEYGLRLNAKDEATYIGTILWRAKDQFVNLERHGYWPRDVAYTPAGYDPANPPQGDASKGHEDEPPTGNSGSSTDLGQAEDFRPA